MDRHLTRKDVAHVAMLARLELSEEELDRFATQLSAILGHADAIASRELSDVPPTSHALELVNVFRVDVVGESCDRDEVLAAAPAHEQGRFKVPTILSEEP